MGLNSSQHHCNPDSFSMLSIIFIKIDEYDKKVVFDESQAG